jgi:hypothetical protein
VRISLWVAALLAWMGSAAPSQVIVRRNPPTSITATGTKVVDNASGHNCADTTNNGTEAAPYCTVTYGIAHISGGQTLYVKNGTYAGDFTITGPSGTSGAHTVLSAYPGHAPVLDHGTFSGGRIKITGGCSYIDFIGFTITNHNQGLYLDDDSGTSTPCDHVTVDSVIVHDVGQEGIAVRAGSPTGARNFIVKNSTVYNTGRLGSSQNGEGIYVGNSSGTDNTNTVTLLNNTIHDTQDECIELKGDSHDVIVDGNTIYNCLAPGSSFGNTGGAIEIDEPRNSVTNPNQIIRNNTIHDIAFTSGITKRGIRVGTGATIYNNVLYNISSSYSCILSNTSNYTRVVYHNTVDCTTGNAIVNSGTTIDSQNNIGPATSGNNRAFTSGDFFDAAGNDYRLAVSSPAHNAGANLTATVAIDILGRTRFTSDIGAYEGGVAATCSTANVTSAISAATAGEPVYVPAGTCTWSSAITISGKALVLVGAGIGNTVITDGAGGSVLDVIGASSTNFVRVTGFTWIKGSDKSSGSIAFEGTATVGFRFDHNRIVIASASSHHHIVPTIVYGLIDHNTFDVTATSGSIGVFDPFGSADGNDGGFTPWTRALSLGTENAVYFEDNTVSYPTAGAGTEDCIDAYGGARLVIRYNTFTNCTLGFHGLDSGSRRSVLSYEIYNNTQTNNSSTALRAVTLRGGSGVIYSNTYNGSGASWGASR